MIFYQLLVTFCNVINGAHTPGPGTPSFLRSSVESIPQTKDLKNEALISVVAYGETSLPLRSAVESIPSIQYVKEKLFFH